ncbi:MAG: hypothetical protein HY928_16130 [Elusimicrobia bacterium]|nr:hypothetical protein [Elusimicrobiota bacterium]
MRALERGSLLAAALVVGSCPAILDAGPFEQRAADAFREDGALRVQATELRRSVSENTAKMREASQRAYRGGGQDRRDDGRIDRERQHRPGHGQWDHGDQWGANDCRVEFSDRSRSGEGTLVGYCRMEFKTNVAPGTTPYLKVVAESGNDSRTIWADQLRFKGNPRYRDENRDGRGTVQGSVQFVFAKWRAGERGGSPVSIYAEANGARRPLWSGRVSR